MRAGVRTGARAGVIRGRAGREKGDWLDNVGLVIGIAERGCCEREGARLGIFACGLSGDPARDGVEEILAVCGIRRGDLKGFGRCPVWTEGDEIWEPERVAKFDAFENMGEGVAGGLLTKEDRTLRGGDFG